MPSVHEVLRGGTAVWFLVRPEHFDRVVCLLPQFFADPAHGGGPSEAQLRRRLQSAFQQAPALESAAPSSSASAMQVEPSSAAASSASAAAGCHGNYVPLMHDFLRVVLSSHSLFLDPYWLAERGVPVVEVHVGEGKTIDVSGDTLHWGVVIEDGQEAFAINSAPSSVYFRNGPHRIVQHLRFFNALYGCAATLETAPPELREQVPAVLRGETIAKQTSSVLEITNAAKKAYLSGDASIYLPCVNKPAVPDKWLLAKRLCLMKDYDDERPDTNDAWRTLLHRTEVLKRALNQVNQRPLCQLLYRSLCLVWKALGDQRYSDYRAPAGAEETLKALKERGVTPHSAGIDLRVTRPDDVEHQDRAGPKDSNARNDSCSGESKDRAYQTGVHDVVALETTYSVLNFAVHWLHSDAFIDAVAAAASGANEVCCHCALDDRDGKFVRRDSGTACPCCRCAAASQS
jgi:hypothetical protein